MSAIGVSVTRKMALEAKCRHLGEELCAIGVEWRGSVRGRGVEKKVEANIQDIKQNYRSIGSQVMTKKEKHFP